MRRLVWILLLGASMAGARTLPEVVLERMLPTYEVRELYLGSGPATMARVDSASLSEVSAGARCTVAPLAFLPQEGRGTRAASLRAGTYLHPDSVQTVWGAAEFATGRLLGISRSNSIDYLLVAPYVLGDDTGGDLDFRKYEFGGGYSRRIGRGFTLGADLGYRAEIAWRDRDPRVKTIVSDLSASVGVAYSITPRRLVALSGSVRSYTQNCDLDFFNPLNEISALPYTGLGTYYKRFAGNANKNSGHQGLGYGANLRWASADAMGLQLAADFRGMRMRQYLRNFNNLPLAFTDTYRTTLSATYGLRAGASARMFATLSGSYFRRIGTENLFGTAAGASYPKIGSRSPYLMEVLDAALTLPTEIRAGAGRLVVRPGVGMHSTDESLSSHGLRVTARAFTASLGLRYAATAGGKWLWSASAGYCHSMLDISADSAEAEASAARTFGRVLAGLSAACSATHRRGLGRRCDISIALQLKF